MRLPLIAVISLISLACDEPSQPPVSDPKPSTTPSEPAPSTGDDDGEATSSEPSEAPVVEPPAPVGGPHCDQREAKQMCVDFTAHTGVTEVRCHEGAELREGACPSESMIASCTLPSTGVTLRWYEGKKLDDARTTCTTIDGVFEAAN